MLMPYLIQNPQTNQLLEYVSLRAKLAPAEALARLQENLESGKTKPEDLWLLQDVDKILAAFSVVKTGLVQRCFVRCRLEIPDAAIIHLLDWLKAKAEANQTEYVVHFSSLFARDVADLPLLYGWKLENHAVIHQTNLADRSDLQPDPKALEFKLEELQTARFLEFYNPIWSIEPEHFSDSPKAAIAEIFDRFSSYENVIGYYLLEQNKAIAAGLLRTFRGAVSIDIFGVLPNFRQQGWGNRLHRHLLFAAKKLADTHSGGTDFSNTAMRRLLKKNGCTINEQQWAFAYLPK